MGSDFRHRVEYTALRLAAGGIRLLPHRAALALAGLLAGVLFHVFRFRRRETLRRIEAVFGDAFAPCERRRIAWMSLRNLSFNIAELMRAAAYTPAWLGRHIENYASCMERLRQLLAQHGGLVIALPHIGNWDLAGIAVHQAGIRIFSVAGVQHNRYVNDWLNRQRGYGLDIIPRGSSALRQVIRRLRAGEVFAILPDVRTKRPDLSIPFLGGQANLGRGMAQFARVANVPILPVTVRRVGWCRHRVDLSDPLLPDRSRDAQEDLARLTTEVMSRIDAMIRADPGQWFWYNKRWVLEPLEETTGAIGDDAAGSGAPERQEAT
ncbi:MAG: lysophospholipid acyltransferase family protein [Lentisphaerae bacterium]|nr:lysophospholipid acyltransferase family protein [Lentisphaerota bacterium]